MRILIADDHPMILQGTKGFLESLGYTVSEMCSNGSVALNIIELQKPDIAILDVNMPEMSGLEVAKQVQSRKLSCKIILLTMHNEKSLYKKALEYGVYGYLLKNFSSTEIGECIKEVLNGKRYTSPHLASQLITKPGEKNIDILSITEKKILELISQQKNNKQIAEALFISERTIEWHRRNIIEKLDLPKGKNTLLTWTLQNYRAS